MNEQISENEDELAQTIIEKDQEIADIDAYDFPKTLILHFLLTVFDSSLLTLTSAIIGVRVCEIIKEKYKDPTNLFIMPVKIICKMFESD